MQDVEAIVKFLYEKAQKTLKNNGELEPKAYFLILYPGQKTAVYSPIIISSAFTEGTAWMKQHIPAFIQHTWLKKKSESPPGIELKAVCFISDSYVSSYDLTKTSMEEIRGAPMPSKDPKRLEAIQMTICYKDVGHLYKAIYRRVNKKIVFDKAVKFAESERGTTIGGWANDLYPKIL